MNNYKMLAVICMFFCGGFLISATIPPRIYKTLTWDFFKNDRPKNAKFVAFTSCNLNYAYTATISSKSEKIILHSEVTLNLDTAASYFADDRKNIATDLLKHEQGHVDISCIYANKFSEKLETTQFYKASYQKEIKKIFSEISSTMNKENERYDEETNHSRGKEAQQRWNKYFFKNLK